MQYLELVQYLIDELDYDQSLVAGAPGSILASSTDSKVRQIRNAVNRAYRHLWVELGPLNEAAETVVTFNTVAGQENYAIPTYLPQIEILQQLCIGSDPPLRMIPWHEYERKYRGSANYIFSFTGYPVVGSIYQRNLWFYPKPDNVFTVTVRGRGFLTPLSLDTDVPVLPADGHHALMELALYFLYLYEGNPATNGQKEIAMQTVNQLKQLNRAHEDIPPGMVSENEIAEQDSLRRYYLLY